MQITLQYETQLKRAAGMTSESVDVDDGTSVAEIVISAATRHGGAVKTMLLDTDGNVRASVLIFSDDRQIPVDEVLTLQHGQTLTLMSPISGG